LKGLFLSAQRSLWPLYLEESPPVVDRKCHGESQRWPCNWSMNRKGDIIYIDHFLQ